MTESSVSSPKLTIDANVCVWLVLHPHTGRDVRPRFARWLTEGAQLTAPVLWQAEIASAIRSLVHQRLVPTELAARALERALTLDIEMIPLTADLTRAAYRWSERLGQRRAYDGFYLAAADTLGGELWTADERLANSARRAGVGWVHWIGEPV
jgi:predicted nucleic acid-binding protein